MWLIVRQLPMKAGCWDTPLALQDLAEAIPIISENRLPLDWEQFSDHPRPFTWTHLHSLIFTLSVGPPPPSPLPFIKTPPALYSFKFVLYLDATAISNQIKCYLTTSRGNFLEMQYDFTGMLCLQIYYGLLLKEHLPGTQENWNVTVWSIIVKDH